MYDSDIDKNIDFDIDNNLISLLFSLSSKLRQHLKYFITFLFFNKKGKSRFVHKLKDCRLAEINYIFDSDFVL